MECPSPGVLHALSSLAGSKWYFPPLAKLTQEQLAEKAGVKKSVISKIENGKNDIQLSTLYRLLEAGLGKKVNFPIRQH